MNTNDPQGYPKLDIKAARALKPDPFHIRIDSILGGHSQSPYFFGKNQYRGSFGIDPGVGLTGLLRPSSIGIQGTTDFGTNGPDFTSAPLWLRTQPKTGTITAYLSGGSAYTFTQSGGAGVALADGGSLSSSSGNGLEYYDNYLYFAKNTDIARYGPLNGSPAFDGTYWTSTLGKAALTNTTYPRSLDTLIRFPNHFLHRHSDGKLYIADVVGNQGTLHTIQTTKTTVEGDTDNGSTFSKLTLGYGLWPTAIETYGSQIVVALYEGPTGTATNNQFTGPAKVAFWDTTSQNFNSIVWVEFPDPLITCIKNIDGVLYFISGGNSNYGFRISRYIGGSSFEDVYLDVTHSLPFPGGVDGERNKILIASSYFVEALTGGTSGAAVYSLGVGIPGTSQGLFNIGGNKQANAQGVSVLATGAIDAQVFKGVFLGYAAGNLKAGVIASPVSSAGNYSLQSATWQSQIYSIGKPFKITKIRLPTLTPLSGDQAFTVSIRTDYLSNIKSFNIINATNYPNETSIVIRPDGLRAKTNFLLQIDWSGSDLCIVGLPIIIEGEIDGDNT